MKDENMELNPTFCSLKKKETLDTYFHQIN